MISRRESAPAIGLKRTVSGRSDDFGLEKPDDFNVSKHAIDMLSKISDSDLPDVKDVENIQIQINNEDIKLVLEVGLNDEKPDFRRKLITGDEDEDSSIAESQEKQLLEGLVDYCIVLGPASPYMMRPTHHVNEKGQLERVQLTAEQVSMYQATIQSPTESSNENIFSPTTESNGQSSVNTGLFSPTNTTEMTNWLQNDDIEAKIWDRLPRQDHKDLELPSKVRLSLLFTALM